jgi:hypothetical protein
MQMQGKTCKNCKTQVSYEEYFCPKCGNALFENMDVDGELRRLLEHDPIPPRPRKLADWRSVFGRVNKLNREYSKQQQAAGQAGSSNPLDDDDW